MTVATLHTTESATTSGGALTVTPSQEFWSAGQLAALEQIGVEDAPEAQLRVFLQQCQRTGLSPWAGQIYLIGRYDRKKDRTKWTIQTGIDGLRLVAERTGRYQGPTEVEWCGPDGVWRDVWLSRNPPVAARIGVRKSGFAQPVWATAHFVEYAATFPSGDLMGTWANLPCHMLGKVAEALALRKAFPQDLSGLYTAEEMDQSADEPVTVSASAQRVTMDQQPEPAPEPERERPATGSRSQATDQPSGQAPAQPAQPERSEDEIRQESEQALADYDWTEAIQLASKQDPAAALDDLRSLWYSAKASNGVDRQVFVDLTDAMRVANEQAQTQQDAASEDAETAALDDAREAEQAS